MACGVMIFIEKFSNFRNFFFHFILFHLIFLCCLCYYCSINAKRQSELSGLRPDTSSLVVPTFDTKVTEYLCSGWVFFSSDKFRLFN